MISLPSVETGGHPSEPSTNGVDALRRALHGGALQLENEEIQGILSHRKPQLLLDRVLTLIPGQSGVGIKSLTGNESGLAKRRHGFVFPSTFALEALAQLAGVVLDYESAAQPIARRPRLRQWLLASVESFDVAREITEVGQLVLSVQLLDTIPHVVATGDVSAERRVSGQAYVNGHLCVTTQFQLAQLAQFEPTSHRAVGF
ncbi:MAG: hypothetical protein ACKVX7_07130 [Planctomycetota bacterium]